MQKYLQTTLPVKISRQTLLNKNLPPKDYIICNGRLVRVNSDIYLQGSGPQFINTGFKPTANTEMEVSMACTASGGDYPEVSCGSRVGANNSAFVIYARYHSGNVWFVLGNYTSPYQISNSHPENKHTYKLSAPQTSCWFDGELKSSSLPSFNGNNFNIYLFGLNNAGYAPQETYRLGKIYYVKIWDNDTLVRHFVPVPEGLVIGTFTVPGNGMFDIVNQQFYANAGTGTFTCSKGI